VSTDADRVARVLAGLPADGPVVPARAKPKAETEPEAEAASKPKAKTASSKTGGSRKQ
jgi:hypothetical protein